MQDNGVSEEDPISTIIFNAIIDAEDTNEVRDNLKYVIGQLQKALDKI